ncbi:MAG: hypothetical protein KDC46_07350, partial [Thermoleophilia bacterium]|nr:hypothetical protein [Thermoleophilia bacterium]
MALIFAIVLMILIMGFLAVFTVSSIMSRDERQTERGRMQSEIWSDAAANAIAARLESGELGYQAAPVTVAGVPGRILYPKVAGVTASHGSGSCGPAFPITTSNGGKGWYCVRPPAAGLPAGTGFLNLAPTDPRHGSVTFVVRAWGTVGSVRPIDVELTFGRQTLSRFAVLSDSPIYLDKTVGAGSLVLPA